MSRYDRYDLFSGDKWAAILANFRKKDDPMSRMSDLDLMVQDGARTAEDFEDRGFGPERARAMAQVVANSGTAVDAVGFEGVVSVCPGCVECGPPIVVKADDGCREEPDSAVGHGPGCFGECDGEYDCS